MPVLRGFHVNLEMDVVHKIPMTTILVTIDHCFMYITIFVYVSFNFYIASCGLRSHAMIFENLEASTMVSAR